MSYPGFGLTIFDPGNPPSDYDRVAEFFSDEFFIRKFNEQWTGGRTWYTSEKTSIVWSIPNLDSGRAGEDFSGLFTMRDKGISFNVAPSNTIYQFVKWVRSIVPSSYTLYFLNIAEFVTLNINDDTSEGEIVRIIEYGYKALS